MKYLVYLLVVLNLAWFAWQRTQPPPEPQAPRLAPLPEGVEPLVLLPERKRQEPEAVTPALEAEPPPGPAGSGEPQPEAGPAAPPAPEPEPVAVVPVCRTLGPVASSEQASELVARLSAEAYPTILRDGETQVPAGYQVYLPPMSGEQARQVVARLQEAGMTDYFVGRNNRISLGIFSSRQKAEQRRQAIRELGYDARLDTRYRTRKVYWIDFQDVPGRDDEAAAWRQILASDPALEAQRVSCE